MKNATKIVCILDRSGSMNLILDDAIGGFNSFLEQQKALPGEADITVALFDHDYELPFNSVPLQSMQPLDRNTFVPRGMTALYDAIGRTISSVGVQLASLSEADRPNKVIVLILTDGQENSSKEYSAQRVEEMIRTQRKTYSWEFVFVGATEASLQNAKSIGIAADNTVKFTADSAGTRAAYTTLNAKTARYRSGG